MSTYVYALADPESPGHIRYVGKTVNMSRRLANHVVPSKLRRSCHVARWLAKLTSDGKKPVVRILETLGDDDDWESSERKWIAKLRSEGHDLTNTAPGGEGGATNTGRKRPDVSERMRGNRLRIGIKPTILQSTGQLIASKARERWAKWKCDGVTIKCGPKMEGRKRISEARKGKRLSDEHRAKLSAAKKGSTWSAKRRAASQL